FYAECAQQRGLCALAHLEGEDIGAVQDTRAEPLERSHVCECERDCARVPADVRARARLVEVHLRRRRLEVAECGLLQVEGGVRQASSFERGKERLLPLRVLVN